MSGLDFLSESVVVANDWSVGWIDRSPRFGSVGFDLMRKSSTQVVSVVLFFLSQAREVISSFPPAAGGLARSRWKGKKSVVFFFK